MSDTPAKQLLTYNGHQHYFETVTNLAGSGPKIDVKIAELNLDAEVTIEPPLDESTLRAVVFLKYDGKYIVLAGKNRVADLIAKGEKEFVKGSLLSTPALKKARVYVAPPESIPEPAAPTEFVNRPRWVDRPARPAYPDRTAAPRYGAKPAYSR